MGTIDELRAEIKKASDAEEALTLLNTYISTNPGVEEAYILRGLRHWSMGHRADAIRDYHTAISLNPDSRAREALKAANAILDYRNKDLLNP